MNKVRRKKIVGYILFLLIIELFICNFRTWVTIGYQKTDMIRENWVDYKDGQYEEGGHIVAPFLDNGWCDVDTKQIDLDVKNIYLCVQYLDSSFQPVDGKYCVVDCTLKATDEGNALLYGLASKKFCSNLERGNYYSVNLYGNARSFELTFQNPGNKDIKYVFLSDFMVNKRVPFYFSWLRFLGIGIGFIFIGICKVYWKQPFYLESGMQQRKSITVAFVILLILYSLTITNSNPAHGNVDTYKTMYHELAERLLQGKFYLEEEPAKELLEMDNPYDTGYRNQIMTENDQHYKWDSAYYNGKYYVYFGVVPVLMLFLPYYVITGQHLPMTYAISILGMAYIIGCFLFLWQFYKKFLQKASFLSYLLWSAMMVIGCNMVHAFRASDLYSCPILTAAVLTVWAFYFWISEVGKRDVNYRKIAAGSSLLALVAGSRPQYLIASFAVLIIFQKEIWKKIDRKWLSFVASVLMPVISVAVVLMYYNYARFDSPFDFGANYNLTLNDMTHRGWHLDLIPSGLFYYLFEPTKITLSFPYVQNSMIFGSLLSGYVGRVVYEELLGGLFFNSPVFLLSLVVYKVRKYITDKDRQLYKLAWFFVGCGWIIVIVDMQMAGIFNRYHMDFAIFFCISAMIVMGLVLDKTKEYMQVKWLHMLLAGSFIWRFVYELVLWLNDGSILAQRPFLIFYLRNIVEFWH